MGFVMSWTHKIDSRQMVIVLMLVIFSNVTAGQLVCFWCAIVHSRMYKLFCLKQVVIFVAAAVSVRQNVINGFLCSNFVPLLSAFGGQYERKPHLWAERLNRLTPVSDYCSLIMVLIFPLNDADANFLSLSLTSGPLCHLSPPMAPAPQLMEKSTSCPLSASSWTLSSVTHSPHPACLGAWLTVSVPLCFSSYLSQG